MRTYLDGLEHLLHQFPGFGEPLAEQRVAVDLYEVAVVEAGAEPHAQLVKKRTMDDSFGMELTVKLANCASGSPTVQHLLDIPYLTKSCSKHW